MEVEVHHGMRQQHQATHLRREDLSLARIHPVLGIQVKRYEMARPPAWKAVV